MYKSDGGKYELWTTTLKTGQILLIFITTKLRLRQVKAFFASIRTACFSGCSYCERSEWIACSIYHFRPRQSCVLSPKKRRLFSIRLMMHLLMRRRRTSHTPIGQTPGFLFKGVSHGIAIHCTLQKIFQTLFQLPDEQQFWLPFSLCLLKLPWNKWKFVHSFASVCACQVFSRLRF